MKKTTLLLLLIIFQFGYSQEVIINDSISIELKKSKKVSKKFNARSSTKVKSNNLKKVLTRCKIKAIYKQPIDINAFSLLDTINKLRYRVSEYIGYKGLSIGGSGYTSKMYLKKKILNKKGKPFINLPKYDPSIEDSFEDFYFNGYTNIEIPIDFGRVAQEGFTTPFSKKKKNLISAVYYSPTTMNQFTAEIFFTIIESKEKPKLELYYGKEKISNIEVE